MMERCLSGAYHFLSFLIIVPVFLFLAVVYGYGGEVRGVTDNTIKLGVVGDLTGPVADIWVPCAEGIKTYFRYINDQGGIHGRKIEHILEDDRLSIPLALAAFKKLVFRDKVLTLMAASGAGHTHAIIPLCEKDNIPLMAVTNNKDFFQPVRRYVFTPLPFYSDQVKLIFDYLLSDMKIKSQSLRIASAYPDIAAGKDTRDSVREEAKASGIKLLTEVVIPVGAGDCSSQILNLKRVSPDYVIVHGYIGNMASFLRDAKKLGFPSISFTVQYGCVDPTVRLAGDAARNMMGVNAFGLWHEDSPGMNKLRKVTLTYHPGSGSRDTNYVQGWFAAMLIVEALKNAGRDLNGETLVGGYEKIRGFDTQGICGIVDYGPNDHKPIDYHRIYKADVKTKQIVPVTGWRKTVE